MSSDSGSVSCDPVLSGKSMAGSRMALAQIMSPHDTNLLGTVHGGHIMKLVDSIAGVVAARHSEGAAVTASVDEMLFQNPVRVGDVVHLDAQLNWTGSSSMEVGVRVSADRWDANVPRVRVATAYLVMVAVDEHGKPRKVAPIVPESAEDQRRFDEAKIRREHRLAQRQAIEQNRSELPQ